MMVVVPLPPFALDVFFTFNIALSLVVLLATIYSERPLDFAVFPTVLLVTTLLRLGAQRGFHPRRAAARPRRVVTPPAR
jgi:flagellar biosynthesis component FlhA